MQLATLLALGFLVAIILGEIILRIWTPSSMTYKRVRRPDPILHHSLRPSTSYTEHHPEFDEVLNVNSLGMRDYEVDLSDTAAFRILILGDSFTEGIGVLIDSTFSKRIERRLNSSDGRHVRVLNFGVTGYSPILEYLALREKGIALHPRLVVLFYDMTDVQEDVLYAEDAEFDLSGKPVKVNPSWPSFGRATTFPRSVFKTYIQEYSYVYGVIAGFLNRVKPLPPVESGNIHSARYSHTVDSVAVPWKKFFERSQSYVKMIRDLCTEHGIDFVLVTYPRGHQVNPQEWATGRRLWGLDSVTRNSAIFPSLQLFADHNKIPFLNMTPTYRAHSKGDLYFPYDGHWTSAGHALATDTLFDFLTSHHLVPVEP